MEKDPLPPKSRAHLFSVQSSKRLFSSTSKTLTAFCSFDGTIPVPLQTLQLYCQPSSSACMPSPLHALHIFSSGAIYSTPFNASYFSYDEQLPQLTTWKDHNFTVFL